MKYLKQECERYHEQFCKTLNRISDTLVAVAFICTETVLLLDKFQNGRPLRFEWHRMKYTMLQLLEALLSPRFRL